MKDRLSYKALQVQVIQLQEELRKHQDTPKVSFDSVPFGIAICGYKTNKQGTPIEYILLRTNKGYFKHLGLSIDIDLQLDIFVLLPNSRDIWKPRLEELIRTRKPLSFFEYISDIDKILYLRLFLSGENQFTILFETDNEALRYYKNEVEKSAERYVAQYENFPSPVFIWEKRGDDFEMISANKAAYIDSNQQIENIFNIPSRKLWKDEPELTYYLEKCINSRKPFTVERNYVFKATGLKKYVSASYGFLPPNCIQITTQDITAAKKAELALRKSELQFRSFFDFSPVNILITELNARILDCNKAMLKNHGIHSKNELINKSFFDLIAPEYRLLARANFSKIFETGNLENIEVQLLKLNKNRYPALLSACLLFDENRSPYQVLINLQDITHRKKAEEERYINEQQLKNKNERYEELNAELKESICEISKINTKLVLAKEKAEESDRLKSAFLANMSHEIRTPMNGILGFSELLTIEDISNEKKKEFVETIRSSGFQLLRIVNDIIDISKIEIGQIEINNTAVNVNYLLHELLTFYQPAVTKKKLVLELNCALPDDKSQIFCDYTKLRQILDNLINNAIKFTENGSVKFGYNRQHDMLEFYVSDTGLGIPQEFQKHMFQRFSRANRDNMETYGGTGLGLSISKAFIDKMGGDIHFNSIANEGTTFLFRLPYWFTDYEEL